MANVSSTTFNGILKVIENTAGNLACNRVHSLFHSPAGLAWSLGYDCNLTIIDLPLVAVWTAKGLFLPALDCGAFYGYPCSKQTKSQKPAVSSVGSVPTDAFAGFGTTRARLCLGQSSSTTERTESPIRSA